MFELYNIIVIPITIIFLKVLERMLHMKNSRPVITEKQKEAKAMEEYIKPLQQMLSERKRDLEAQGERTLYIDPKKLRIERG